VICGRREDVLKQTAEELAKETGGEIETVGCDVRVPDAVEAMMERIWQKRPRLATTSVTRHLATRENGRSTSA
jgi:short-subunit dehydrogenase